MASCPLPAGSRLWAYLRVSSDDQAARGLVIAGMRQAREHYAREFGLVIARWFIDEAVSGGSTAGRDAFNEMVGAARQRPRGADGIFTWHVKRFARNLLDSQFYKASCAAAGGH